MERCIECERIRREMQLRADALIAWAKNPLGPNIEAVTRRMREEAKAKGDTIS